MHLGIRGLSLVVIAFCAVWALFSTMARNEYVASVHRRLESRRVDLHMERITVSDVHTIRLLEETAAGENPRQAAYAIGMLPKCRVTIFSLCY